MQLIPYLIMMIAVLPIVSALLMQLLGGSLGRRAVSISISFMVLTFLLAVANLAVMLMDPGTRVIGLHSLGLDMGRGSATKEWGLFLLDPLSALMALVIAGISLIVHLYSRRYMAEEAGYVRFFILLDLMTATLLMMVAAGDLITLLVTWHLVGVLLYFLLGQDNHSHSAWRYGFWTLLTYRIGDLPMVLAAVLMYTSYGSLSLTEIFAAMEARMAAGTGQNFMGLSVPVVVGALVALAAFARSAQFLLHTWLPYTMGGPTPVSAFMHAGIVNAGGFLVNRFAPVYVHAGDVLHVMFVVGLITAIIGSVLMLTQHDIKKALGYSTMGQMGFMIMECGVGAFSLAVYHLIAHGVFKGTLFLGSGNIISEARQSDGVPKKDLYTFVVERKPGPQRRPWLLMAAFTLIVPGLILFFGHYLVEHDFLEKQGAIVLLFFGWMTGAQLIFATYRMQTANAGRLFALMLVSFTIVVLGYSFIAHAFELFLYPDQALSKRIYAAAGVDLFWFNAVMTLLAAVIVLGWLFTYYGEQRRIRESRLLQWFRQIFYRAASNELYVARIYSRIAHVMIASAERLNTLLRWR